MSKCMAEELAREIRKERGLPSGVVVPLLISCPCERCSPRLNC